MGSLGRSGALARSLSRNTRPALRREGSESLSSLAISGVELRDLHNRDSGETSGHKSPEQQHTPDLASNTNSSKETAQQRVSFDNPPSPVAQDKRGTVNVRSPKAPSRQIRKSDPPIPSSPISRALGYIERQKNSPKPHVQSGSQSQPSSRATSPLRILQQWSSGFYRQRGPVEEPFVLVNPYAARSRSKSKRKTPKLCRTCLTKQQQQEQQETQAGGGNSTSAIIDAKSITSSNLPYGCTHVVPFSTIFKVVDLLRFFVTDTLPRQFYLNFLLCLPALYFSRVARIFEDAEVSKPDIQRMVETGGGDDTGFFFLPSSAEGAHMGFGTRAGNSRGPSMSPGAASGVRLSSQIGVAPASAPIQHYNHHHQPLPCPEDWAPPLVSPALMRFKVSWETFIDSLMREWKTLNLVSALLLS